MPDAWNQRKWRAGRPCWPGPRSPVAAWIDAVRGLRLTRVCLERPCISQCLEKGGIAKYWSISKRINYSHCVGSYGAQAYRLDYTIACASGPERPRDRKVCLQMWKVNVLNTSRSEWISQGEHYSKVKIGFFPPPVVEMVNVDLKNRNTFFFFSHSPCFNPWLPETARQRESWWTNHELISGVVSVTPSARHPPFPGSVCVCVCPNGRGRRCGFMWSYKPSGWAELC